jgi:hypothetical protein
VPARAVPLTDIRQFGELLVNDSGLALLVRPDLPVRSGSLDADSGFGHPDAVLALADHWIQSSAVRSSTSASPCRFTTYQCVTPHIESLPHPGMPIPGDDVLCGEHHPRCQRRAESGSPA